MNNKSSRRRLLLNGIKKTQSSLKWFVSGIQAFNQHSFGEIQFYGSGSSSTYAPFVTCKPSIQPAAIWRLLIEQWCLPVPNIIISISGSFPKRDYTWLNVMNEAWLFTTGSSPCRQTSFNSCTIAILPMNAVAQNNLLFTESENGIFPVFYEINNEVDHEKRLDQTHTHFIFVEGDFTDAAEIKRRLFQFIETTLIDINGNEANIPTISVIVSDNGESLLSATRSALENHPVIINSTANELSAIVERSWMEEYSTLCGKAKEFISKIIDTASERVEVLAMIKQWILKENKVLLFPTANLNNLTKAIILKIISCEKYTFRSKLCLAMTWNCQDDLQSLVSSRKQFEQQERYVSTYLMMTLSQDRAEFLEYLQDLGVNIYSKLSVKMLWFLYHEALYNDQFETDTSFILRRFVDKIIAKNHSNLLWAVGQFISCVTKDEVSGLYSENLYKRSFRDRANKRKQMTITSVTIEDDSDLVLYPVRDLFLWCILLGKDNLSKVFWKDGQTLSTSAIVASAICCGQANCIDFKTHDSALADELNNKSSEWLQVAINFLSASFKLEKGATLCQLTRKIKMYAGCSAIDLAFATGCKEFVAQPAAQSALDYIWLGKTKKDQPKWKLALSLLCPLLVPFLNNVDNGNYFSPAVSRIYQSTYSEGKVEKQSDQETGIGGVVKMINNFTATSTTGRMQIPKKQFSRFTQFTEDIFDYFNSPKIKFLVHSMYLVINIILMSVGLLLNNTSTFGSWKHIPTILVLFFMIGLLLDEVRQILLAPEPTVVKKIHSWMKSTWNRMDLAMTMTYFVAVLILWSKSNDSESNYVARIFLSVALLAMYMRCFQIYLVFPYMGPKIYMMGQMMKDLVTFLYIMCLIFFCYGVILGSLHDDEHLSHKKQPETFSDMLLLVYNFILREPYWQIYGNALGKSVEAQYDLRGILRSLITAFYLLFSNILMVNLLIAMFSYTFQNIQEHANSFWKFHRYQVVREFCNRPWLPSPFIIIEDIVRFLQWFKNKIPQRNEFKRTISREQEEILLEFEKEVLRLLADKMTTARD